MPGDSPHGSITVYYTVPSEDPGSTPQRVGQAHFTDQPANFERHLWPAAGDVATSIAGTSKTRTIPTDDRFRLHDHQALDYKR